MKRILFIALLTILGASSALTGERPLYAAHDIEISPEFVVKDFNILTYSPAYMMSYARIHYSGKELLEYVRLDCRLYKHGELAGVAEAYGDYKTYGQNGMWPGAENYYSSYITRVDFDSVVLSIKYSISNGLKPRISKEALSVTRTSTAAFGSSKKIAGLVKNISTTVIPYPSILICVYRNRQMLQYQQAFADAPGHKLLPGESATFYSYVDLPEKYDRIVYLSNTAVPDDGRYSFTRVGMQTANNPVLFYLSQI